jgi:uncharacterized membrane protein
MLRKDDNVDVGVRASKQFLQVRRVLHYLHRMELKASHYTDTHLWLALYVFSLALALPLIINKKQGNRFWHGDMVWGRLARTMPLERGICHGDDWYRY